MPPSNFTKVVEILSVEPSPIPNDFYSEYIVDCNRVKELPDFIIILNERKYKLTSHEYTEEINGLCYLLILPLDFGGAWIFGIPFMQRYFTVFDLSSPPSLRICRSINP